MFFLNPTINADSPVYFQDDRPGQRQPSTHRDKQDDGETAQRRETAIRRLNRMIRELRQLSRREKARRLQVRRHLAIKHEEAEQEWRLQQNRDERRLRARRRYEWLAKKRQELSLRHEKNKTMQEWFRQWLAKFHEDAEKDDNDRLVGENEKRMIELTTATPNPTRSRDPVTRESKSNFLGRPAVIAMLGSFVPPSRWPSGLRRVTRNHLGQPAQVRILSSTNLLGFEPIIFPWKIQVLVPFYGGRPNSNVCSHIEI